MKVKTLIEKLKELPQDAKVYHLWDGEPRSKISVVYKARNGNIITSGLNQICYSTESRPIYAPTEEENQFWTVNNE